MNNHNRRCSVRKGALRNFAKVTGKYLCHSLYFNRVRLATLLTLFRMGIFGLLTDGGGRGKKAPLSKICHTYPTMMKLGTVIPYLKKIQKYMNHVTHALSSTDISIFSPEITKFCYIKKYRYRLHFDT